MSVALAGILAAYYPIGLLAVLSTGAAVVSGSLALFRRPARSPELIEAFAKVRSARRLYELVVIAFLTIVALGRQSPTLSALLIIGGIGSVLWVASYAPRRELAAWHGFLASSLFVAGVAWVRGASKVTLVSKEFVIGSMLVALLLLVIALSSSYAWTWNVERVQWIVILSLALYLCASVFAYFVLNLRSASDALRGQRAVASSSGILQYRITFPFTNSINSTPYLAAALVVVGTAYLLQQRKNKVLVGAAVVVGAMILVLGNGRTATLVAILLVVLTCLSPAIIVRFGRVVSLASLLLPTWWLLVRSPISALINLASAAIPFLERSGSADPSTLQGRVYIWQSTFDFIHSGSWSVAIFGLGAKGQVSSGLILKYAYLFGDERDIAASVHNSLLQQLIDTGVVGALLLLFLIWLLTSRLAYYHQHCESHDERIAVCGLMAVVITLAVSGGFEETLGSGSAQETYWFFMLISVLILALRPSRSLAEVRKTGTGLALQRSLGLEARLPDETSPPRYIRL